MKIKAVDDCGFRVRHSHHLINTLRSLITNKAIKRGVGETLCVIAYHWNKRTGLSWPSKQTIASIREIDIRTVTTHINQAKKLGLLSWLTGGSTKGLANRYSFNEWVISRLMRQGHENKRKAAYQDVVQKNKVPENNPATSTAKDPAQPAKKDPANKFPNGNQRSTNTGGQETHRFSLDELFQSVSESECQHKAKLKQTQAYKSAVHRAHNPPAPKPLTQSQAKTNEQRQVARERVNQLEAMIIGSPVGKLTKVIIEELKALVSRPSFQVQHKISQFELVNPKNLASFTCDY